MPISPHLNYRPQLTTPTPLPNTQLYIYIQTPLSTPPSNASLPQSITSNLAPWIWVSCASMGIALFFLLALLGLKVFWREEGSDDVEEGRGEDGDDVRDERDEGDAQHKSHNTIQYKPLQTPISPLNSPSRIPTHPQPRIKAREILKQKPIHTSSGRNPPQNSLNSPKNNGKNIKDKTRTSTIEYETQISSRLTEDAIELEEFIPSSSISQSVRPRVEPDFPRECCYGEERQKSMSNDEYISFHQPISHPNNSISLTQPSSNNDEPSPEEQHTSPTALNLRVPQNSRDSSKSPDSPRSPETPHSFGNAAIKASTSSIKDEDKMPKCKERKRTVSFKEDIFLER